MALKRLNSLVIGLGILLVSKLSLAQLQCEVFHADPFGEKPIEAKTYSEADFQDYLGKPIEINDFFNSVRIKLKFTPEYNPEKEIFEVEHEVQANGVPFHVTPAVDYSAEGAFVYTFDLTDAVTEYTQFTLVCKNPKFFDFQLAAPIASRFSDPVSPPICSQSHPVSPVSAPQNPAQEIFEGFTSEEQDEIIFPNPMISDAVIESKSAGDPKEANETASSFSNADYSAQVNSSEIEIKNEKDQNPTELVETMDMGTQAGAEALLRSRPERKQRKPNWFRFESYESSKLSRFNPKGNLVNLKVIKAAKVTAEANQSISRSARNRRKPDYYRDQIDKTSALVKSGKPAKELEAAPSKRLREPKRYFGFEDYISNDSSSSEESESSSETDILFI